MEKHPARWLTALGVIVFLVVWQVLNYLGFIDSTRVSHPFAMVQLLGDTEFLSRFGGMFIQLVLGGGVGGLLGLGVGAAIVWIPWLSQAMIYFLRRGLWLPFIIVWALPSWPINGFPSVFLMGLAAISLFTSYHLLNLRLTLNLTWSETLSGLIRMVILQSLLFYLSFQFQNEPGWIWVFYSTQQIEVIYAGLILLGVFLFFVDRVFRSNFERTAAVRGAVVIREAMSTEMSSMWSATVLGLFCLILWQALSPAVARYLLVGSPVDVVRTAYLLLTSGLDFTGERPIWADLGISLLEIGAGMILGGVVAVISARCLSFSGSFRDLMLPLLPMTYIIPILLIVAVMYWVAGYTGPWRTVLGIALLVYFPFLHILWGLRNSPWPCRLLLASDEALPYAFVAMMLGEATNAVAGLGFLMVMARATLRITPAVSIALLIFGLLILLSCSLRWIAKRDYLPESHLPGVKS